MIDSKSDLRKVERSNVNGILKIQGLLERRNEIRKNLNENEGREDRNKKTARNI